MSNLVEITGLSKAYGGVPALDIPTLFLSGGKIVGLLGPNGSGKTTLLKLMAGLLTPNAGTIRIDGMEPGPATKAIVSYLPDQTYLPDWMRIRDIITFFKDFYEDFDEDIALGMLERLDIDPKKRLKTLSKGTKEKVQLILVMSRKGKVYLLDEPIGGVDPAARDYILQTIIGNYNPEATVIIATHLIADVEQVLDEFIFIDRGQVKLQSTVDDIRESKGLSVDGLFREVFKC